MLIQQLLTSGLMIIFPSGSLLFLGGLLRAEVCF